MPTIGLWILVGLVAWLLVGLVVGFALGRTAGRSPALPEPERADDLAPLPDTTGRRRILIVDDDPGLRLLLRTTLGLDEFVVEEASAAEGAAHIARFWSPAVVILDVALPGMDGFRFCRELKRNERYGSPFVLLLTGRDATREEVEQAGPDAVLR